jgi:ferrous iron transport protein B
MKKHRSDEIIVAVAGQPNSGKSTIFNMLTGARQHVANYPGVTVEKKTGRYEYEGSTVTLVDLPGTYSLTSYSPEERVARDFLLHEKPAVVLDIVDASNLERNLYLTFQLAEMGVPLVIALNMMDVAEDRGFEIDKNKLGELLNASVVPTVGSKGRGQKELKEAILNTYKGDHVQTGCGEFCQGCSVYLGVSRQKKGFFRVDYGKELEPTLKSLEKMLSDNPKISARYPVRWLSVKLIEGDAEAFRLVEITRKEG